VIDLLCPSLSLGLEMDELPEVVARHVLDSGGLHLHLCHRDQHLHHPREWSVGGGVEDFTVVCEFTFLNFFTVFSLFSLFNI